MMPSKLLAIFGDHPELMKLSKSFSRSLVQMVVIWIVVGWNSLRSPMLEVVLRWFLNFLWKYSLYVYFLLYAHLHGLDKTHEFGSSPLKNVVFGILSCILIFKCFLDILSYILSSNVCP